MIPLNPPSPDSPKEELQKTPPHRQLVQLSPINTEDPFQPALQIHSSPLAQHQQASNAVYTSPVMQNSATPPTNPSLKDGYHITISQPSEFPSSTSPIKWTPFPLQIPTTPQKTRSSSNVELENLVEKGILFLQNSNNIVLTDEIELPNGKSTCLLEIAILTLPEESDKVLNDILLKFIAIPHYKSRVFQFGLEDTFGWQDILKPKNQHLKKFFLDHILNLLEKRQKDIASGKTAHLTYSNFIAKLPKED